MMSDDSSCVYNVSILYHSLLYQWHFGTIVYLLDPAAKFFQIGLLSSVKTLAEFISHTRSQRDRPYHTHTQQQLDRQSLSLKLKRETYWPSWVIFCPCIFHDKSILRNCWIPPITQIIWNDPPFNRWLDSLTISPWFQVKLDSLSLSSPDWVKIGSKTHLASYKSIWKRKTIEGKARVGFAREGLETWNSFRKKLIWSISNKKYA